MVDGVLIFQNFLKISFRFSVIVIVVVAPKSGVRPLSVDGVIAFVFGATFVVMLRKKKCGGHIRRDDRGDGDVDHDFSASQDIVDAVRFDVGTVRSDVDDVDDECVCVDL